jgi:hypothetical protein
MPRFQLRLRSASVAILIVALAAVVFVQQCRLAVLDEQIQALKQEAMMARRAMRSQAEAWQMAQDAIRTYRAAESAELKATGPNLTADGASSPTRQ